MYCTNKCVCLLFPGGSVEGRTYILAGPWVIDSTSWTFECKFKLRKGWNRSQQCQFLPYSAYICSWVSEWHPCVLLVTGGLLDINRQTECPAQWSDSMGLYPIFAIFKAFNEIMGYWWREDDSLLFQQSPYANENRLSRVLLGPCCFPKALPFWYMGYKWLEKSRKVCERPLPSNKK